MTKGIDHARLAIIFNDLRLPAIKHGWPIFAERADKRGWPAARFLAALAEARLPPGKPLDSFDDEVLPMISEAYVMAICSGDSWLDKGANFILLGGPGGGQISSHLRHRPSLIANG